MDAVSTNFQEKSPGPPGLFSFKPCHQLIQSSETLHHSKAATIATDEF